MNNTITDLVILLTGNDDHQIGVVISQLQQHRNSGATVVNEQPRRLPKIRLKKRATK
jgi:hypothetical protein